MNELTTILEIKGWSPVMHKSSRRILIRNIYLNYLTDITNDFIWKRGDLSWPEIFWKSASWNKINEKDIVLLFHRLK